MKKNRLFLTAVTAGVIMFLAGTLTAAPAGFQSSANRKAQEQAVSNESGTEQNTVMMVDTSVIKIVKNKKGEHGFQLKNLDVLWGTRAACCAIVALFLNIILGCVPKKSKQTLTVLFFIAGAAFVTGFYPMGISYMIYEWNPTYGLASAAAGLFLTIINIALILMLIKKIKEIRKTENAPDGQIPNIFPGADNGKPDGTEGVKFNTDSGDFKMPDIFPGNQQPPAPPGQK
jgi:hypothetical protein